jgi:hypothetical protein
MVCPAASPWTTMPFIDPLMPAIRLLAGTSVGSTRQAILFACRLAIARSLTRKPRRSALARSTAWSSRIPLTSILSKASGVPNARLASRASLCALSTPSTSRPGSASA